MNPVPVGEGAFLSFTLMKEVFGVEVVGLDVRLPGSVSVSGIVPRVQLRDFLVGHPATSVEALALGPDSDAMLMAFEFKCERPVRSGFHSIQYALASIRLKDPTVDAYLSNVVRWL